MSLFEVVQAIQSAGVGVIGLDSRRTVVVLWSVDDQDVGETAVIRFRCASQRIETFGGSHEGKVKRHPVTSSTVARVRIDDERAGPPSSPIQTYKQSWISTTAAILEPLFSITPVCRFWLVKTYQYGCHPFVLSHHDAHVRSGRRNVMNHIASRGTIFGRFFVGVRGIVLPWVILRRERHHNHIWIFEHSNILWRQFPGGVMSIYGKWVCLWPYMGTPQRHGFLGWLKLITPYYWNIII
jgi:hypothetical protein